ncbi:MAG: WXG100 family type VII secretion target [Anaerolineales bacterium]|nr:WXG100 family type VII secretion target [Anaerolineales bacterium]
MPTIHMDIEKVKAVWERTVLNAGEIEATIKSLTAAVDDMVGKDWIGNAATDFKKECEEFHRQVKKQSETMGDLSEQMRLEIVEWEAMNKELH